MTILNRYICREFLKIFFLSMTSFIIIYLVIAVLENVDDFVKEKVSLSMTMKFFAYQVPLIVVQVSPVATLLSSLITLGILSRNSEIIAIMTSGISLYKIATPVIWISILVSAGSLFINEAILPYTNQKARYIENVELEKKNPLGSFKQNRIWYRSKNAAYNIDLFDPFTNTLKGITIYYLDKDFHLIRRLDAKAARWIDNKWLFHEVSLRNFQNRSNIKVRRWKEKTIHIPEVPEDFKAVEKATDEMSYTDLRSYIKKIEAEGYQATKYLVDMHVKLAFPFVNLIMPLIGIPFALKTGRSKGIIGGVGISIVISLGYWIMLSFSLSLGHSGVLPPIVSAWISNITFLTFGIFMLLNARS